MNIDERIKRELENQSPDVEAIIMGDQGLFERLFATFRSNMRGWMILINSLVLLVTAALVYCGYQFFTASGNAQSYWGTCTLMLLFVQGMMKQWIFMEVNRASLMREIKRLELRILEMQ